MKGAPLDDASTPSSDTLPSYSESVLVSSPFSLLSLPRDLAASRSTIISSLIVSHILPHLHFSSLSGISKSTLLLIPSDLTSLYPPQSANSSSKDASSASDTFPGETIVGFPSAENLTLVRLRGEENSLGFWHQPTVILELEEQLRTRLRDGGHEIVGDSNDETISPRGTPQKAKRGFSGRKSSNAEWRAVEEKALAHGQVRAGAEIREICLRVENEIGLYETRKGKAIMVRVEVGV